MKNTIMLLQQRKLCVDFESFSLRTDVFNFYLHSLGTTNDKAGPDLTEGWGNDPTMGLGEDQKCLVALRRTSVVCHREELGHQDKVSGPL